MKYLLFVSDDRKEKWTVEWRYLHKQFVKSFDTVMQAKMYVYEKMQYVWEYDVMIYKYTGEQFEMEEHGWYRDGEWSWSEYI